MKIKHVDGREVDTDTLSDVDSLLMEKSKELHELFAMYNRQLFLVGEMRGHPSNTLERGVCILSCCYSRFITRKN